MLNCTKRTTTTKFSFFLSSFSHYLCSFLPNRQGVAIGILQYFNLIQSVGSYSAEDIGTGLQDFLICIEMFVYSVYHLWVFDYKPFQIQDPLKKPFIRTIIDKGFKDATVPLLENFKDTVHPKHDLMQTKETLTPAVDKLKQITEKMASGSFKKRDHKPNSNV